MIRRNKSTPASSASSSSTVINFQVTFCKKQKQKKWQEGTLKWYTGSKKASLVASYGQVMDTKFFTQETPQEGDELEFDSYQVLIEQSDAGEAEARPSQQSPEKTKPTVSTIPRLTRRAPLSSQKKSSDAVKKGFKLPSSIHPSDSNNQEDENKTKKIFYGMDPSGSQHKQADTGHIAYGRTEPSYTEKLKALEQTPENPFQTFYEETVKQSENLNQTSRNKQDNLFEWDEIESQSYEAEEEREDISGWYQRGGDEEEMEYHTFSEEQSLIENGIQTLDSSEVHFNGLEDPYGDDIPVTFFNKERLFSSVPVRKRSKKMTKVIPTGKKYNQPIQEDDESDDETEISLPNKPSYKTQVLAQNKVMNFSNNPRKHNLLTEDQVDDFDIEFDEEEEALLRSVSMGEPKASLNEHAAKQNPVLKQNQLTKQNPNFKQTQLTNQNLNLKQTQLTNQNPNLKHNQLKNPALKQTQLVQKKARIEDHESVTLSYTQLNFLSEKEIESLSGKMPNRTKNIPPSFSTLLHYKNTWSEALYEEMNLQLTEFNVKFRNACAALPGRSPNAPKCVHGVMRLGTAGPTSKNPGRQYFSCPNTQTKCKNGFQWKDEWQTKQPKDTSSKITSTPPLQLNSANLGKLRASGIKIYTQCELIYGSGDKSIATFLKSSSNNNNFGQEKPRVLYLKLSEDYKEGSSNYMKDDLWIISSDPNFDVRGFLLFVKSVSHGPAKSGLLEVAPIENQKTANNKSNLYALHGPNWSSELNMLDNLANVSVKSLPIVPYFMQGVNPAEGILHSVQQFGSNSTVKLSSVDRDFALLLRDEILEEFKLNEDQTTY